MRNYFNNQKGIAPIVIILILVGVLILVGGGIWYWQQQKELVEKPIVEEPIAEELTVKDCGAVGPENPGDGEKVMGCFESKFKDCKPAKMVMSIDMGPLGGLVTYYYEIIGPEDGLCKVKSKFIANPNPDWVGKEMVCKYDNSKIFETAVKDLSKCQGPLYDLMMGR